LEFFDQLSFEQNGFRLAANDMDIDVVYSFDEGVEFQIPPQPPSGMKILTDPFPQVASFPHVNDRSKAIFHQVHPRLVGQLTQFVPHCFCFGHGVIMPNRDVFSKV
jgi:hypothetical protein